MRKEWAFIIPIVVIGVSIAFSFVAEYLNLVWPAINLILVFIYQAGYAITYVSLLVCLFTLIITLLWYPRVRRKFSSPVKHAGASVLKLVLCTLVIIVIVQIYLTLFHPSLLYQASFWFFFIYLGMCIIRYILTLSTALARKRLEQKETLSSQSNFPFVTVIVPAYNEEKVIGKTIEALLKLSYPNKEIIIVDDGSTDKTLEIARSYARNDSLKVLTKPNGGKWDALNTGVKAANGEFILCIDADTLLDQDAIQYLVKHFEDPKIGAVAGNVKVGNRQGLITKLQALEYIIGISLFRRSEAYFRKVVIVPGSIGAFRTSLLKELGLFDGDTFAEDGDVTLKILKAGYKTMYEPQAIGYTEAPNNITTLAKQRYRWYRGYLQCLSKHRDMIFSSKYESTIGTFIISWALFNGIFCPWFTFFTLIWLLVLCFNPISPYTVYHPINEVFQLGITSNFPAIPSIYISWFFFLLILEGMVAVYALSIDIKEKRRLVSYIIFHKLFYVYMVEIIRMLSQLEEVFHYPMRWEKIEHYGTVMRSPNSWHKDKSYQLSAQC